MKALKYFLVLFSFAGIIFFGCSDDQQSPVSPSDQASLQKVAQRDFIGTNTPTETINEATWKYPDGKILFLKYKGETVFEVNFLDGGPDIMSGAGIVEINGITDLDKMIGKWHGKFTLTPNANTDGGIWQSTWIGTSTFAMDAYHGTPGWLLPLTHHGHGEGGSINGMQCRYVANVHANPDFSAYYAEVEGVVTSH